jgi:hypothetical protein
MYLYSGKQKNSNPMKLKSMIMMAGVMVLFAAISVSAQSQDELRVKILRTPEAGVVKLVYGINTEEKLRVRFLTAQGEVASDVIRGSYPKGFMKRYDVREIYNNKFWIEIASDKMTVVYLIVPSKDGKRFTPYLEKTIQNYEMVAQK